MWILIEIADMQDIGKNEKSRLLLDSIKIVPLGPGINKIEAIGSWVHPMTMTQER